MHHVRSELEDLNMSRGEGETIVGTLINEIFLANIMFIDHFNRVFGFIFIVFLRC